MSVHCFTSFTFSYLSKARVLARSVKRHCPDWRLWAVIPDAEPKGFAFRLEEEPFDAVIWAGDLPECGAGSWVFQHDVVELCTAVKGPALRRLLSEPDADKIVYLDPDIAVFSSLSRIVDLLDEHSILLTPHQISPDHGERAVIDNEICSLATGAYNLGFLAIRNNADGRAMAEWWAQRLMRFCHDDRPRGLFVDQKWCDLAPCLFDGVKILRDPGCNVASWNLSRRKVAIGRDGSITVNGAPLRFFHFTKLGPVADEMTERYAGDNVEVYELWSWYKRAVAAEAAPGVPPGWWRYGAFSNGELIPKSARILYRQRRDLRDAFPDPFDASGGGYFDWLKRRQFV
jgi:hypothetical protein